MDLENDYQKKFEEKIKKMLQEQYENGFNAGVAAISKVVLSKIDDKSVSLMDRITAVKRLCSVSERNKSSSLRKSADDK